MDEPAFRTSKSSAHGSHSDSEMGFLMNRAKLSKIGELFAVGAYAVLVTWIAWHHEPWADEAQAWLIARDSSLSEIFLKRMHYEGTPGLWHALLWAMIRVHVSYTGMHWIIVGVGIATAYVLVRFSPFPLWIRLLLPFSFAFTYQTAVIARSYSLVPILVFAICMLVTGRRERPMLFAILAGLLANLAVYSALLSLGFVVLYLQHRARLASGLDGSFPVQGGEHGENGHVPARAVRLPKLILPAVVLFAFWGIAVYTAIPAPDVDFGRFSELISSHEPMAHALAKVTGIPSPSPFEVQWAKAASVAKLPMPTPAAGPLIWFLTLLFSVIFIAFFAASSFNILAACFYGLLFRCMYLRHKLSAAIPLALVLVGGYLIRFADHHISLVWTAVVAGAWITFSDNSLTTEKRWITRSLVAVSTLVLIEQLCWTLVAANPNRRDPFSESQECARFIASVVRSKPIAGFGFFSVASQPYFPQPVFFNQPKGYWPWNSIDNPNLRVREVVGQKPPYILFGEIYYLSEGWRHQLVPKSGPKDHEPGTDQFVEYLTTHGYSETHRFCGRQPAHFGYSEETCQVIYEPETAPEVPKTLSGTKPENSPGGF